MFRDIVDVKDCTLSGMIVLRGYLSSLTLNHSGIVSKRKGIIENVSRRRRRLNPCTIYARCQFLVTLNSTKGKSELRYRITELFNHSPQAAVVLVSLLVVATMLGYPRML